MTKREFMTRLTMELLARNVADPNDVVEEYEQHFDFKLKDGYSEEEIAERLGDPAMIAKQFCESNAPKQSIKNKPLVIASLCLFILLAGLLFVLLVAWGFVMIAGGASLAGLSAFLISGVDFPLLPIMPYWCKAIFAPACMALAVLTAVACVYYAAFLRQLIRCFNRIGQNMVASASGGAVLPNLPINPQFSGKAKRRLRTIALIALIAFAVFFVLGFVACVFSADNLEFWHTWGWFANEIPAADLPIDVQAAI